MTWNELKQFCNSLTDEQLQKNVILWREDEAITEMDAEALNEDFYINREEDEGCYPGSEATEPLENLEKVYDKGHPILFEDFQELNKEEK